MLTAQNVFDDALHRIGVREGTKSSDPLEVASQLARRRRVKSLNFSSTRVLSTDCRIVESPVTVSILILRDIGIKSANLSDTLKLLSNFRGITTLVMDCNWIDIVTLKQIIDYTRHHTIVQKHCTVSVMWNPMTSEQIELLCETLQHVEIVFCQSRVSRPVAQRRLALIRLPVFARPGDAAREVHQRLIEKKSILLGLAGKVLMNILGKSFDPSCLRLDPFGSLVSGFYLSESSDVDVCIHFTPGVTQVNKLSPKQQHKISEQFVMDFNRIAKRDLNCQTESCKWAKVPLVKMFNWGGFRELNIILGSKVGIYNSNLLSWYARDDSTLYWVGMQVKTWAKQNGLVNKEENHYSFISAYTWILMVIFFFQVCVRSALSIQERSERTRVNCWGSDAVVEVEDTRALVDDALTDASTAINAESVLCEFFTFYAYDFDWEKMTVDIKYPEKGLECRMFDTGQNGDRFAAIRDPYERKKNLARGMTEQAFTRIMSCLRVGLV